MTPSYDAIKHQVNAIAAEMQRIGLWEETPPPVDSLQSEQAFGMDKLVFSQWLQWVFIPRVVKTINQHSSFPSRSEVGAQAVREFDGLDEAEHLVKLLSEFDALIGEQGEG